MKRHHEATAQVLYDLMANGIGHKLSQKIDEKLEPILCKLDSIYQESQNNSKQIEKLKVEIDGVQYSKDDVWTLKETAAFLGRHKTTVVRYEKKHDAFQRLNKIPLSEIYYLISDIVKFKLSHQK